MTILSDGRYWWRYMHPVPGDTALVWVWVCLRYAVCWDMQMYRWEYVRDDKQCV